MSVDPLAEDYMPFSPYNYVLGNPISSIDPDGRGVTSTIVQKNDDGTYSVSGGDATDGDRGVYVDDGNGGKGQKIGESITTHSFFGEDGSPVLGAIIDLNSTAGQDFLDNEIVGPDINILKYMLNATGGEDLDFKTRNIKERPEGVSGEQYVYRGSVTSSGLIGSARDFGNIAAGIVAGRFGLNWKTSRAGFDGLQTFQDGGITVNVDNLGGALGPTVSVRVNWSIEGTPTQLGQRVGFSMGQRIAGQEPYYRTFRPFQKTKFSADVRPVQE